jgi:hypothetical protein
MIVVADKHQMTSTKYQTNFNGRNSKYQTNSFGHLDLAFGIYLRFGVWDLEFEV